MGDYSIRPQRDRGSGTTTFDVSVAGPLTAPEAMRFALALLRSVERTVSIADRGGPSGDDA